MRGSSLQWSFSKSSATNSQILSFKSAQDQEGGHKLHPPGFPQRNLPLDHKQEGSQYPIITVNSRQHNDVVWGPEAKGFPINDQAKQMGAAAITTTILPSYLDAPKQAISSSVGPTSALPTVSVLPPNSSVVGSTDLKSSLCISSDPCQLTIFYNGSVCVYDNVSPEKAQAIMLLADNGDSTNSNAPPASISFLPKVQPPLLSQSVNDTAIPGQSKGFPGVISLPASVNSLSVFHPSCPTEVNPIKPVITPNQIKGPEAPKSGGAGGIKSITSALPQARKASLARFLEKRKDRVTAASPYIVSKNGPESSS